MAAALRTIAVKEQYGLHCNVKKGYLVEVSFLMCVPGEISWTYHRK